MKEFKTGKVKIRLRPAPAALKIALIALIVFSVCALVALRWVHNGIVEATAEKQQQRPVQSVSGSIIPIREISRFPMRCSPLHPGVRRMLIN